MTRIAARARPSRTGQGGVGFTAQAEGFGYGPQRHLSEE
jgi:hypothetical protein